MALFLSLTSSKRWSSGFLKGDLAGVLVGFLRCQPFSGSGLSRDDEDADAGSEVDL